MRIGTGRTHVHHACKFFYLGPHLVLPFLLPPHGGLPTHTHTCRFWSVSPFAFCEHRLFICVCTHCRAISPFHLPGGLRLTYHRSGWEAHYFLLPHLCPASHLHFTFTLLCGENLPKISCRGCFCGFSHATSRAELTSCLHYLPARVLGSALPLFSSSASS